MSVDAEGLPQVTRFGHFAGRLILLPILNGALRLRRRGSAHIPSEGPTLIVSNHVSNADPPLIGAAALPRILYYMAKVELFQVPLLRQAIVSQGAFPVDRGAADREAMRTARGLLKRGECLLMFPEGTRHASGQIGPTHAGAGTLALLPGVTVVPAAIWGSQRRFGPVRVAFGPPVDLSDLTSGSKSERARIAIDRAMEGVAALLPTVGGPTQLPHADAPGDG